MLLWSFSFGFLYLAWLQMFKVLNIKHPVPLTPNTDAGDAGPVVTKNNILVDLSILLKTKSAAASALFA